jgi:hypothetical protein
VVVVLDAYHRWRYNSYARSVRRRRTEEVMGWICVPLMCGLVYIGYSAYDNAMTERAKPREQRTLIPDTSAVSRAK